jgi:hypothetical protein
MASFDNCNIGSFLGGYTFCNRYASGKITNVYPGLGFEVENDFYRYLIVNKFSSTSKMSTNFLEYTPNIYNSVNLTDETILFWLQGGCRAKSRIYGVEVGRRCLINCTSDMGLHLRVKMAPFICSGLYSKGMDSHEEWVFLKETGKIFPDDPGDSAPLPREAVLKNEVDKQENKWHLLRSRSLTAAEAEPYKYTFLQCGKKLLVELDGKKKATVNYSDGEVHLYTPAHSAICSPAAPFVLSAPPSPEMEEISNDPLWVENKFVNSVQRLTDDEIDEGIEEAYWEMKRFRIQAELKKTPLGPEFMNSQMWVDAAYDEKQYRREQLQEPNISRFTGIV